MILILKVNSFILWSTGWYHLMRRLQRLWTPTEPLQPTSELLPAPVYYQSLLLEIETSWSVFNLCWYLQTCSSSDVTAQVLDSPGSDWTSVLNVMGPWRCRVPVVLFSLDSVYLPLPSGEPGDILSELHRCVSRRGDAREQRQQTALTESVDWEVRVVVWRFMTGRNTRQLGSEEDPLIRGQRGSWRPEQVKERRTVARGRHLVPPCSQHSLRDWNRRTCTCRCILQVCHLLLLVYIQKVFRLFKSSDVAAWDFLFHLNVWNVFCVILTLSIITLQRHTSCSSRWCFHAASP